VVALGVHVGIELVCTTQVLLVLLAGLRGGLLTVLRLRREAVGLCLLTVGLRARRGRTRFGLARSRSSLARDRSRSFFFLLPAITSAAMIAMTMMATMTQITQDGMMIPLFEGHF
jgi:hypothetical protein